MTDEQINIAIAEAVGNIYIEKVIRYPDGRENGRGNTPSYIQGKFENYRSRGMDCELIEVVSTDTDYCNDLNAMHEVENTMRPHDTFEEWLSFDKYAKTLQAWFEPEADAIHASARHRAEAYLRTIGKWEEEV